MEPGAKGESLLTGSCLSFFFFWGVAGVLDYFGHRSISKNNLCSSHSARYFQSNWRWVILILCGFSDCGPFNSREGEMWGEISGLSPC